jgi:hypothetical protein
MHVKTLADASKPPNVGVMHNTSSCILPTVVTYLRGTRGVRELMGWVRNVVLIKCIFGSGKTRGGSGFWVRGYMGQVREQGS